MLITCWSSKGGSGTTVVATALATLLAAGNDGVLLVDLGGDVPAALGLPEPPVGLAAWSPRAHPRGGGDLLRRLEVDAGRGLRLLPRGSGPLDADAGPALAEVLGRRSLVVVDAGTVGRDEAGPALDLASAATRSLLVMRPCFLALRRAAMAPIRASGVVLVDEPQRVLGRADVESALDLPVVAEVPWDPAVARRVDAGLLGAPLPRAMARALLAAAGRPERPPLRWPPGGPPVRPEAVA